MGQSAAAPASASHGNSSQPATNPSGVVPGCITAKVEASRPRLGINTSAVASMVSPTDALVVCNSALAVAVTSTVVEVAPI